MSFTLKIRAFYVSIMNSWYFRSVSCTFVSIFWFDQQLNKWFTRNLFFHIVSTRYTRVQNELTRDKFIMSSVTSLIMLMSLQKLVSNNCLNFSILCFPFRILIRSTIHTFINSLILLTTRPTVIIHY